MTNINGRNGSYREEDVLSKLAELEVKYPGITEQYQRFEGAELPPCPHCGAEDTASVQVGIIGRTINLAALCRKFKLVPNGEDKLGEYFCNECGEFFD
jgi:hypothetical protein